MSREKMREIVDDVKSAAKTAISAAKHSASYPDAPAMGVELICDNEMQPIRTRDGADTAMIIPVKTEEKDDEWKEYVRGVVYGGLDGVLTMFALLASAVGSDVSIRSLMAMGVANVLADGMSMGFGGYVSSLSEVEQNQATRERVGCMHDDDVASHLLAFYMEKGLSADDARSLVGIFRSYPIFMKERYCAEIEGVLPAEEDGSPVTEGKITFQSFLIFGSLPLLPIMIALLLPDSDASFTMAIGFSILFTVLTLGMLGYTKARLASQPKLTQVGLMVTNGIVCAAVSFLVSFGSGEALENLLGGN